MVDYSKWEKLNVSSSSDDSEGEENSCPRVRRFEKPQSVTFGGSDPFQSVDSHKSPHLHTPASQDVIDAPPLRETVSSSSKRNDLRASSNACSEDTSVTEENVSSKKERSEVPISDIDVLDLAFRCSNGGFGSQYAWSQTATEVTATFLGLPLGTKGRDVTVAIHEKGLSHDNTMGETLPDSTGRRSGRFLTITIKESPFIEQQFSYPVILDDNCIFWELKTFSRVTNVPKLEEAVGRGVCNTNNVASNLLEPPVRVLLLTVAKANLVAGVTLWWNCLFVDGPTIDVSAIPERATEKSRNRQKQFREAWEAAHTSFLTRVKAAESSKIAL